MNNLAELGILILGTICLFVWVWAIKRKWGEKFE